MLDGIGQAPSEQNGSGHLRAWVPVGILPDCQISQAVHTLSAVLIVFRGNGNTDFLDVSGSGVDKDNENKIGLTDAAYQLKRSLVPEFISGPPFNLKIAFGFGKVTRFRLHRNNVDTLATLELEPSCFQFAAIWNGWASGGF